MKLDPFLRDRFSDHGSHRKLRAFDSYGPRFLIDDTGRSVLNFASNDYLGLSTLNQSSEVISQPSSRLLAGNTSRHLEIEELIADFLYKEASLTFPSGYTANLGVLSTLPQKGDLIVMDRLCHASLLDGARLSGARIERFKHQDLGHAEDILIRLREKHKQIWMVSEGLFSMDGDLCSVRDLVELKEKHGAFLIVDEAHSMGIYGNQGRGWAEEEGFLDQVDILTFNFSKSFALQGGVVAGSGVLKESLVRHCRQQIYTTATPISHITSIPSRLEMVKAADKERHQLKSVSLGLSKALNRDSTWSPIIPYQLDEDRGALHLAEKLWHDGVFCPAILPPTVPPNTSRLRISLNALHQEKDIQRILQSLGKD